jgi:peptidyl-prolyl cis-trans isomerase B (cyclophilin B)
MRKKTFLLLACTLSIIMTTSNLSAQQKTKSTETIVLLKTTMGDMKIKLYNETPLHRDNFIKLVNEKYYDGLLFHRVINNFMIQGGDPNSRNAPAGQQLGMGGPGYTIPAEILPQFNHKKGAVAAARMDVRVNPKKESSGSQFYIVHNSNRTSHLNGDYTVFGEVIEGMDVIDKIANVQTGTADRPVEDVKIISASIVK